MPLHTIVSELDLFYAPPQPGEYRRLRAGLLQGKSTPEGLRIERVLSTDPADYLRYAPGDPLPEGEGTIC